MSKRRDWDKAKRLREPTRDKERADRLDEAADNFLAFGKLYNPNTEAKRTGGKATRP